MQHARIRELTARSRLRLRVEDVVRDVNRFLRGWAGYFRYGNSARFFDKISRYAVERLAAFVAKPHQRGARFGWWGRRLPIPEPPRVDRPERNPSRHAPTGRGGGKPNAEGEETSVSRVRENRMHGSMGGGR